MWNKDYVFRHVSMAPKFPESDNDRGSKLLGILSSAVLWKICQLASFPSM